VTLHIPKKTWPGAVREVTLGAGTRRPLVIGGGRGLPLHTFEAVFPHRPLLALEVTDVDPVRWPDTVRASWDGVLGAPDAAARRAVDEFHADLVMVHLIGTHPDRGDRTPDEAVDSVRRVLGSVPVPVIVKGPGTGPKQNEVLSRVAEQLAGERLVLHSAAQEDYKTLAAVSIAYGHVLVAESPIDLNIAKQVNILLADAGMDVGRLLIDPLTGGLGYGLEYTYSVMQRIRLAALGGDPMLNCPVVCLVGEEAWKAKEVKTDAAPASLWGDRSARGMHWEIATALPLIEAGADLVVLRHPGALAEIRRHLDTWFAAARPEGA
jgi:acetyl-CoA decarbonylase/synthase, CODH/ACS complex subunit delta